jgi:hypothetical protein
METLVWAVNLLAVTYLCFWALKQNDTENGKRED